MALASEGSVESCASTPPRGPADGDARVLVVDDSASTRHLCGEIIARSAGLGVLCAQNGQEALEIIGCLEPAVVLTDLQMPGMGGLELVVAIRAEYPRLPVVLMTTLGSEDLAMQALQAGAASYVPKKTLERDLPETLLRVLSAAEADRGRRRLAGFIERSECVYRLENDSSLIAPLIGLLQDDLDRAGLGDSSTRTRVGVALQEALANALYHGNLEVSSDLRQEDERRFYALAAERRPVEPYRSRRIHVHALLRPGEATFAIRDDGPGFDTRLVDRPVDTEDLLRVSGRGLLLIRTFMDEVRFNDTGNQITLVKRKQGLGRGS